MNEYDRTLWNDALLPSQFAYLRRAHPDDPNKRLWLRVLVDGVYRYLKRPNSPQAARLRAEVATWLALDDDAAGSYRFICWALDIDPDFLRHGVYRARMAGESPFLRSEPRRSGQRIGLGDTRKGRHRRKVSVVS